MPLTSFCGVNLPQIKLEQLQIQINSLDKDAHQSLYFLYSEFLIRASRNSSYRDVLNKANITTIDGKGLEWTNQALLNHKTVQNVKKNQQLILVKKLFNSLINIFSGIWVILLNQKLRETNNQVILGRDFVYYLFNQADLKRYKVAVIGGNQGLQQNLQHKFPNAEFKIWQIDSNSNLMRDISVNNYAQDFNSRHSFLNQDNLFIEFPELVSSIDFLGSEAWDYILITIGGASGKQEFLCNAIQNNKQIQYRLIAGVGAALDHLGGNNNQKQTPKIFEKLGLEWVFRITTNPKRAVRILDSVITLWWLTSKEQSE